MVKPYVVVYATVSVDAGISLSGKKVVLSSDRDLSRLHHLRSQMDAIMVGANTIIIDNPILTVRLPQFTGKQPYRVVVDRDLRTDPNYRVYDVSTAPTIIITSMKNSGSYQLRRFTEKGVEVILTDVRRDGLLDMEKALEDLNNRFGVKKILVEGGGFLIASLIKQNLIDEFIISVAPVILGLGKVSLVNDYIDEPVGLKLVEVEVDNVSGEVLIHYRLQR